MNIMKVMRYFLVIFILCGTKEVMAQSKRIVVAFYNVENFFDTIREPSKLDQDFTPQGSYAWNSHKYHKKLANLERVFYNMSLETGAMPAVIGVCEIENRAVLEDLVSTEKLLSTRYQISHFESPDARGIDVGLLYRPDIFKYEGCKPLPVKISDLPDFKTRDILMVWGRILDEPFWFFVCHWPSRLGGKHASEFKRVAAAEVVRNAADSVIKQWPDAKIVIMGDLNDDPTDKSVAETLGAKGSPKGIKSNELFCPYIAMCKDGYGTLAYMDMWNNFDNFIVNGNLLDGGALKLYKPSSSKYYGYIYKPSFIVQQSGQHKNYPYRTFTGTNFIGGYSDHFPVYIYLTK